MRARLGTIALTATWLLACAPDGPTAIVVGTLLPDEDCVVSGDSTFLLKGSYDTALGRNNFCANSYNMNLLVNSYLISRGSPLGNPPPPKAEPNVLQLTHAEVGLFEVNGDPFPFNGLSHEFQVTTAATIPPAELDEPGVGVALVEVIPISYALDTTFRELGRSRGTVVAAVKLFGTTTGGVDIEFAEYRFPIQLCENCYTVCAGDFNAEDLEDMTEGMCDDNAGADGRLCIQPLAVCR